MANDATDPNAQILAGVRVVDLSFGLAGPLATQFLAEIGADVVKVEPPSGDPTRAHAGFATWNRSKRGVVLDLDAAGDRARLETLLAGADVLVHSLRPSKALAFGLDDAAVRQRHPSLVVCTSTVYPPDHPRAEGPQDEILLQAWLGVLDEIPGWRKGPIYNRFVFPAWHAALLGATAMIGRLITRHRTGHGGVVHANMLQGALQQVSMQWNDAERPEPNLTAHRNDPPMSSVYLCNDDRWVQIMNVGERINVSAIPGMRESVAALGMQDEPFNADTMAAAMLQRSSDEWLKILRDADVPVEPAADYGEMLLLEQAEVMQYVVDVDDPQWGRVRQPAAPYTLQPPARVQRPAPTLGEHDDEVFDSWPALDRPAATGADELPLDGTRMLDFGQFLAGPFAPVLCADFGAEVIKVEPLDGDRMRNLGAYFQACQRNKRSVALDLKHPRAKEVLEPLLRWSTAVHHNVRDRGSKGIGIDLESMHAVNPNIVFSSTNAYGKRGPSAGWPGFDPPFEMASGWSNLIAGEGNIPMYNRFAVHDQHCALTSLLATMIGLYRRDVGGLVTSVEASLLGGAVMSQSETLYLHATKSFVPVSTVDTNQTGTGPGYRIYQCKDDEWVAVVARGDALTQLTVIAGVDSPEGLEAVFADLPYLDVIAYADKAGGAAEHVTRTPRVPFLHDADNRARHFTTEYEHFTYGRIVQTGEVVSLGDLRLRQVRSAPVIGQHTREVLLEMGLVEDQIVSLAEAGCVTGPDLPAAVSA